MLAICVGVCFSGQQKKGGVPQKFLDIATKAAQIAGTHAVVS